MRAMIFAAGKGTRLKPLTDNTPKALVKLNGIPMIEYVISKLKSAGVSEIIINVHYLAEQIIDFLKEKNYFGIRVEISDETKELLDTGGGLKKASRFFNKNEPFIIYNTDIISDIDLKQMLKYHNANSALVTLAVRKRETNRYLLFNKQMKLCGWKNNKTGEIKIPKKDDSYEPFAFSGIHIVNPQIFNYINRDGAFSIIEFYLSLINDKNVYGYDHSFNQWFDIGTPENLKAAENYLKFV